MFGTNAITVSQTITIKPKNRIIIPSETGATIGDKIYFIHNIYRTKLSLYNEEEANQKLDVLLLNLHNQLLSKQITYQEYIKYKRYICALLCFPYQTIRSSNYLTLPKEALTNLKITNSAYLIGVDTHLELYKSAEEYHQINHK